MRKYLTKTNPLHLDIHHLYFQTSHNLKRGKVEEKMQSLTRIIQKLADWIIGSLFAFIQPRIKEKSEII